jgi:hypothetical protein
MAELSDKEPIRSDVWERLERLTKVSLALTALVYTAGWNYLQAYYESFGLNFKELSPSQYDVLIFSIPVLSKWQPLAVMLVVAIAAWGLGGIGLVRRSVAILLVALVLGLLLLSFFARRVGVNQAVQDMHEATSSLPNVHLSLDQSKSRGDTSGPDFASADFRLLMRANGQIFVFQPLTPRAQSSPDLPPGNIAVYVIPETRVQQMTLERGTR